MLTAKFSPPHPPPTDILRPRLLDRLRNRSTRPVLISAPAGWGKSRLAGQFAAEVAARSEHLVWMTADRYDDATEMWANLYAATRFGIPEIDLAVTDTTPPVAARGHTLIDRWLTAVDHLARPTTLIVDDVGQIDDPQVLDGLQRLVTMAPPGLSIVLITRHDPPLPIHQWRMDGRLTEIRAADLATTPAEATELLAALGVRLDPADVDLLVARTEGWIGGIRMVGQLLGSATDPTAAIHAITDGGGGSLSRYLIEQVVSHLDVADQEFLRAVSVLPTIPIELAAVLGQRPDALPMLRRLADLTGLIAPVDAAEQSFRCHRLLAAAVRYELIGTDPDRVDRLLLTASSWYADHDRPVDAVRCAVQARHWERARDQLTTAYPDLVLQGRAGIVRRLTNEFPSRYLHGDPELAGITLGARLWFGDLSDHDTLMAAVRDGLPRVRRRDPGAATLLEFRLELAAIAVARVAGDFPTMVSSAERAEHLIAPLAGTAEYGARRLVLSSNHGTALLWSGRFDRASELLTGAIGSEPAPSLPLLNCLSMIGWIDLFEGRLDAAEQAARRAVEMAGRHGWSREYQVAPAFVCRAVIALERGDPTGAEAQLGRADESWQPIGELAIGLTAAVTRARIATARGRPDEAMGLLERVRSDRRIAPTTELLDGLVRWARAEAAAAGGDWPAMRHIIAQCPETDGTTTLFAARAAMAGGRPQDALLILSDPAGAPGLGHQLALHIRRQLWLARACQLTGQRTRAVGALRGALDVTHTEGYRLPFAELGPHARPLLRLPLPAEFGARADLIDALLAEVRDDRTAAVATPLVPTFTPREQDLLSVLPTRLSNDAIANLLHLSTNTVKTHLRSVYRKLEVDDRDSAVDKAGRLGLL